MNTNFNLPPSTLPVSSQSPAAPTDSMSDDIQTDVGQLILKLAKNFLPNEIVLPFTLQKVKILKEKGISLSNKLSTNQVRHIASELGVLSLTSEISKVQSKPIAESEMALNILNFSGMTDEELLTKEQTLENDLKQIEIAEQIKTQTHVFIEALNQIKQKLPFIDENEMLSHFHNELKKAPDQNPKQIPPLAKDYVHIVQTNATSLVEIMEKSRQYITTLVSKYFAEHEAQTIELLTIVAVLPVADKLHVSETDFQTLLNQIYTHLTDGRFAKDLEDQLRNESNHRLWNQFLEEYKDIQAFARQKYFIDSLSKEELQEVETAMDKKWPEKTKTWSLSTSAFKKRYIQPAADARNDLLQKLKNRSANEQIVRNLWEKYEGFLWKKAKEVYHVTPPESLLTIQYEELFDKFITESALEETPENFKEYLENKLYGDAFVAEWLSKVASYKEVIQFQQKPEDLVRNLWKKEMGPIQDVEVYSMRQQKLNQLIEQAVNLSFSGKVSTADFQKLEDSIAALRPEINSIELEELKELLLENKEITKNVANEIMNDWTVIGTRVQHNLTLLTREDKERIINTAKHRSQLPLTLDKVKEDLEHHVLTPNPVVIESKYKKLKELMVEFPQMETKHRYSLIINKALLEQELLKRKSQTYNRGSSRENQLLKRLNFTPKDNNQSSAVSKMIENLLQSNQLSQSNADQLKKEIREAELNVRLKAAGVADNELENMKKLIKAYENLCNEMQDHYFPLAKKAVPLDEYDNLPHIKRSLQRTRYNQVVSQISSMIDIIVKQDIIRKALSLNSKTFEKKYLPLISSKGIIDDEEFNESFKTTLVNDLKKRMGFYEKWHDKLKVDAIQGLEDKNECLRTGVCLAKCLRVGTFEKTHPDAPVDQIGGDHLTAMDRFQQARYDKAFKDLLSVRDDKKGKKGLEEVLEQAMTVPKEVLTKFGYKQIKWMATSSKNSQKIADEAADQMNDLAVNPETVTQLEKTNGVLFINIEGKNWGHALNCRFDFKRGVFRIHDPNIGIFEIPVKNGQKIQAAKELSQLFKDIIETLYSDTSAYYIFQLI